MTSNGSRESERTLLTGLALARSVLDRDDSSRSNQEVMMRRWTDPSSRLVTVVNDTARIVDGGSGIALDLVSPSEIESASIADSFFLGNDETGAAMFGASAVDEESAPPANPGTKWESLRDVGAKLGPRDSEMFTTTLGLANWHRTHQRCSKCGALTVPERSGWVRRCTVDQSEHFPRTDPAVIMLVLDADDRALLGNRVGWSPQWYSTLAGFVEPGESAEAAVAREVSEEVGLTVDRSTVSFLGSQPWPFPSSIMLGFHAYATGDTKPKPDGDEIASARWFSREEMRAACESGDVQVPSTVSIARHLIEAWCGDQLPGEWSRR